MGEKITAKVETITPEIAKTMLGENVNNRRISRDNVNLFAREMRNGEWRFNGEALKFGKDGRLLDGQHRLLAVIAADKPLTTLVIRGLEDETQQTMDSGKTRTLGDVLTLRGEKNSTQLASLARAVYLADQLGMEAAAQNDLKPTRGEIISFIDQTPQLADVLAASRAFRSQSGDMLTSSMFASLWWTFAHIDTDAANRFFMSLASGANLQADDPILILRNTLMAQPHKAGRSARDNRVRIAALTIKAWNKWRKGKASPPVEVLSRRIVPYATLTGYPQSTTTVHIKNNQKRNHHGIQQTLPCHPHVRRRKPVHRHHRDKERNPGFP